MGFLSCVAYLLKPPHRFFNRFLLKPVMVSRKTAAINVNNAETIIYNGLYSDYENSKWIQISRHVTVSFML